MTNDADVSVWLEAPRLRIGRAERHLDELDALISAYVEAKHLRLVVEDGVADDTLWSRRVVVRIAEPLPRMLPLVAGDAVRDLRAALDLLACAFVRSTGASDRGVAFPVARSRAAFESAFARAGLAKANPVAIAFVRALDAYHDVGGDVVLCALDGLHSLNTRRPLALTLGVSGLRAARIGVTPRGVMGSAPGFTWPDVAHGDVVIRFRAEDGFAIGHEFEAKIAVTFGKRQPLRGDDVAASLRHHVLYVGSILDRVPPDAFGPARGEAASGSGRARTPR